MRTVIDRLLSFAMVGTMALLLLASLVISAVVSGVGDYAVAWFGVGAGWLRLADIVVSLVATFVLFAMMFKLLPRIRPDWSDVWVGAGITTVLFAVGKYLIGLYLGKAAVGSTFGAAGSFVVLLFWLYYTSLIVLFGAEFTQVYANHDWDDAGSPMKDGKAAADAPEGRVEMPAGYPGAGSDPRQGVADARPGGLSEPPPARSPARESVWAARGLLILIAVATLGQLGNRRRITRDHEAGRNPEHVSAK